MVDAHSRLLTALNGLDSRLRRATGTQVQSKRFIEDVKAFVRSHFSEFRPSVSNRGVSEEELSGIDTEMQSLLQHAQKRTLNSKYAATLKSIKKALDELEVKITRRAAVSPHDGPKVDRRDVDLLATLVKVCPSAAASYQQGLADLAGTGRLSWRGTATEFREALRETLDVLAPDDAVTAQRGFRLENGQRRPTMKQKTVLILKSRQEKSAAIETAKKGVDLVEEKLGAFLRSVYDRSSASTHGATSRNEAASIRDHVALLLAELLAVPR